MHPLGCPKFGASFTFFLYFLLGFLIIDACFEQSFFQLLTLILSFGMVLVRTLDKSNPHEIIFLGICQSLLAIQLSIQFGFNLLPHSDSTVMQMFGVQSMHRIGDPADR